MASTEKPPGTIAGRRASEICKRSFDAGWVPHPSRRFFVCRSSCSAKTTLQRNRPHRSSIALSGHFTLTGWPLGLPAGSTYLRPASFLASE